jgi:GTP-binding protein HflX
VSALTGEGIPELLAAVVEDLEKQMDVLTLMVPYDRGDVIASAHRLGDVLAEKHDEEGTILEVRLPAHLQGEFKKFAS